MIIDICIFNILILTCCLYIRAPQFVSFWYTPLKKGYMRIQQGIDTLDKRYAAANRSHHRPRARTPINEVVPPISLAIIKNTSLTFFCISSFSYRSRPYPPRSLAISGEMSRERVRSGAGREISEARHHVWGSPLA